MLITGELERRKHPNTLI